MKSKVETCEFACPPNIYGGHTIKPDAAIVQGKKFESHTVEPLWNGEREISSGCQMKAFNDGRQLPIEHIGDNRDITCVGPSNSRCPLQQGYEMVPMTVNGTNTHVPRKST